MQPLPRRIMRSFVMFAAMALVLAIMLVQNITIASLFAWASFSLANVAMSLIIGTLIGAGLILLAEVINARIY